MKKIGLLFLLLFILPIVNANQGRTFELDFNTNLEYDLWLQKSDRILFEYGGYNHTIIVDEIKNETVELDVFLFLESELHTPDYVYLTRKYNLKLDFNKDQNRELGIYLNNIEINEGKTNIIFKRLEAWDNQIKLKPFWEKETKKTTNWLIYGYIGISIVILVIVFIVLRGFIIKKNKGNYF